MRKKCSVSFEVVNCDIIFSYHLFEFRKTLCRHVAVLMCNDVTSLPERYILKRLRRDVNKAHTRVTIHYDGLVSILG